MKIGSTTKAIELIYKHLPYPNLISDLEIFEDKAIYFTWRGNKYKLGVHYCSVEMVKGDILVGNDEAILIKHILKVALRKEFVL